MQRLLLLGLNHTTAPLAVREQLAFSHAQQRAAVERLRDQYSDCEFVVLSTCNRVEIYAGRAVHGHPRLEEIACFLADFHGVDLSLIQGHCYQKVQFEVAEHLFGVAASLDSMVVGETEILGQVRAAYELAIDLRSVGSNLNPLFQRAIASGKRVAAKAALMAGQPGIAREAVQLAQQVVGTFADKSVLTIGAGEVARNVLKYLRPLNPGRLMVSNRDAEKARLLADTVGGQAIGFGTIADALGESDVVVTSTASAEPILSLRQFQDTPRRPGRQQLVIDLGVPRDVEPCVRALPFVRLHDLDDLQADVVRATSRHSESLDGAREIVRAHLDEYAAWQHARQFGPLIDALYQRYHDLAEQELQRAVAGMNGSSPDDVERLREFARRMVNKLLHDPVQALRNADGLQSPVPNYRGAMRKLFNLTIPPDEQS